jgi:uncharacterized protein YbaR (Trm112 family)
MSIDDELLNLLVCPETRDKLSLADDALVARVNAAIQKGTLKTRRGTPIKSRIDAGLVRPDGNVLYAIVDNIPNLLIDDAITLDQL